MRDAQTMDIDDVTRLLGVPAEKLLMWEDQGLIAPRHDRMGARAYSATDIEVAIRLAREAEPGGRLAMMMSSVGQNVELSDRPSDSPYPAERRRRGGLGRLLSAIRYESRMDIVMDLALERMLEISNAQMGSVLVADFSRQLYTVMASRGLSESYIKGIGDWRLFEGLVGQAFDLREPVVVDDLRDRRIPGRQGLLSREGIRAWACVPLLRGRQRLGIIEIFSTIPGRFAEVDLVELEWVAALIAPLIEVDQLSRDLEVMKKDRVKSFREWAHQAAVLNRRNREALVVDLHSLQEHLVASEAGGLSGAEQVARMIERLERRGALHVDLIPLFRESLEASRGDHRGIEVKVDIRDWPSTLPSEITSQIHIMLLTMVEEAVRFAASAVRVILSSSDRDLSIEIVDDRIRRRGESVLTSQRPEAVDAVLKLLDGQIAELPPATFVNTQEMGSYGVSILIPKTFERIPGERLTRREREVLETLATGRSNRDISRMLGISEKTLQNHLTNLYRKLGAAGRAEAMEMVRQGG